MKAKWRYHLLLFLVCWMWGLAFIAVKAMLDEVSYVSVNLSRFLLASLAFIPLLVFYRRHRPKLSRREWGMIVLAGICAVYGYQLAVNYGETLVPAGTASLVANTTPVFTALLSMLVLHERLGPWKAAGIALALGGVTYIAVCGAEGGLEMGRMKGIVFILIAALAWAVYTVIMRPLTREHHVFFVTAYTILAGTLATLPLLSGGFFRQLGGMSAEGWGWLLFLGLGCTALGYLLYSKGLEGLGATVTAFYIFFIPPISLFWGWLILGEALSADILAGTAMILAGLAAVGWEERKNYSASGSAS
jgi:drug/metabolite transporter (DMT)-like permease